MDDLNRQFTLPSGLRAEELLPHVAARGLALRRRRRVVKAAPVVVALLLLAVPTAAVLRDGGDPRNTRVLLPAGSDPTTSTTADEAAHDTTTTTSTTQATLQSPATTARPTPTTVCRNSTSPACGPFRWDPAPAPADPVSMTIEFSPANPKAGEEVAIKVIHHNPNTKINDCGSVEFGDSGLSCNALMAACEDRYGPWDPPAKEPDYGFNMLDHTWSAPGAYRVVVRYSYGGCYVPWQGTVTAEATVTVS